MGRNSLSKEVAWARSWNTLPEGNLDSDSTLGNPSSLSPCVVLFQSLCPAFPGGGAPGKGCSTEPEAGRPAALPGGQSRTGGGGAGGCQGQCRQARAEGRETLGPWARAPEEGPISLPPPFQALQMELSRAQEAWRRGQQQTAEAEQQLKLVANAVSRCLARVGVGFLLPQPPRHLTV